MVPYTPSFLPSFLPWMEGKIPGKPMTTLCIGSIDPTVADELLQKILESCGVLNKWKRVLDASGSPKPFGFAEYTYADGLDRALRVLPQYCFQPDGKPLSLKVDEATRLYIQKYNQTLSTELRKTPKMMIPGSNQETILWTDILAHLDECAKRDIEKIIEQHFQTDYLVQNQLNQMKSQFEVQKHSLESIKTKILQEEESRLLERKKRFSDLYQSRLLKREQMEQIRKNSSDWLTQLLMRYDDDSDNSSIKNHRLVHQELEIDAKRITE